MLNTTRPKPKWPILHIKTAGLIKKRPADLSAISNRPETSAVVSVELEDLYFSIPRNIINPHFATTTAGEKTMTTMPSAPQSSIELCAMGFRTNRTPRSQDPCIR
jgi:hypothetical protein